MRSFSSALCVLILLTITDTTGSDPVEVEVKVHESATLPCSGNCSGLVRWTLEHDPFHILALCNQTSCSSQEGFLISHDLYLRGDFSLNISDADLRKRTSYTCWCDGTDICTVDLQIQKPAGPLVKVTVAQCNQTSGQPVREGYQLFYDSYLKEDFSLTIADVDHSKAKWCLCQCNNTSIYDVRLQIRPLNILPLKITSLDISDPVEVIYNNGQIYALDGRSLEYDDEHTWRTLGLKRIRPSDSGVHSVQDANSKGINHLVGAQGSESAHPTVTVKLHDSVTLPCSERCSGVVRWTVFHKRDEVLAECDQTSCRSVKEGYQMIHDQYLKGNFSLAITAADFSKRNWYTSDCDGKDLCDVQLKIEPLSSTVHLKPNDSLILHLTIPDPVEVIYNSTGAADSSSVQICTVRGSLLQCRPGYEERVSAALELRGVDLPDGGVYTVRDARTEEVLHVYTVSVPDDGGLGVTPREWLWILVAVLEALLLVSLVGNICLWKRKQQNGENSHCTEVTSLSSDSQKLEL